MRTSLWFVPGLIVAAAAGLAFVLIALEPESSTTSSPLVFGGGTQGAREVLSTIAGSMVTFVGTVFSITVIVLQLASSQFSPGALRTFLRDRRSQASLGVFLGTLVYALIVLWSVRSSGGEAIEFVPRIAMSGAAVLVLLSLVFFVYYIDHVAQSIRVATVAHRIGTETMDVLEERYPESFDPIVQNAAPDDLRGRGRLISSSSAGVLLAVDVDAALSLAGELDGRIEIIPRVGAFVPMGAPMAYWDAAGPPDPTAILRLVTLGRDRAMEHDLAFGLRQLVDIAVKALSPGINDPTTASQAIDQIHNVLRQLALRTFPQDLVRDQRGAVRLVRREWTWEQFVQLAFEEILDNARSSSQINARMELALADLSTCVPDARKQPVDALLARVSRGMGEVAR